MKVGGATRFGGAANVNKGQFPSLQLAGYNRGVPSVERLAETPITINGLTPTPIIYLGNQAAAGGWTQYNSSAALALQAGTAPSYNQATPFGGALDGAVLFNGGGYFRNTDATYGNVTTEDIVFEAVLRLNASSKDVFGKLTGVNYTGYQAFTSGTVSINCRIGINAVFAGCTSAALTARSWIHLLWFADRSGSAQIYINGDASGAAAVISALTASIGSSTAYFSLGNRYATDGAGTPFDDSIAYFSLQYRDAWLDTHLQAALAKQRFSMLTQSQPLYSYSNITAPTSQGSANAAYQSRLVSGNTQLFQTNASWSRWVERLDTNGRNFKGMLVERAVKNFVRQSNNLNTSPWIKTGTASITENTTETTDPVGTNTASKLVGVGNFASNEVKQTSITGFTAGASLAVAFWIKRISTSGTLVIRNDKGAPGGGRWEINLANLPDQWVRITRSSSYLSVPTEMTAAGDGSFEFRFWSASVATLDFYCWGCQTEDSLKEANQDVTTTTVAITKAADNLYYTLGSADIGTTEGAIYFEFLSPTMTPLTNKFLFSASAAGSAANALSVYIDTAGKLNVTTASTGGGGDAGSVISATTKANNIWHWGLVIYKHNSLKLIVDDHTEGEDTAIDVPVGMNQLRVGNDAANTAGLNAGPILVGNIQCFTTTTNFRIRG